MNPAPIATFLLLLAILFTTPAFAGHNTQRYKQYHDVSISRGEVPTIIVKP